VGYLLNPNKLAARVGIEPAAVFLQAAVDVLIYESEFLADAQHSAQNSRELADVVRAWQRLPHQIRLAVLALVKAS
jgi:hypothetical protein